MLGRLFVIVLFVVAAPVGTVSAGAQQPCAFPVSAVDATGTEVTVTEEPHDVVTLSPSAAQTMWEIGAKEKVVGMTKYGSYLEGSSTRTNVSGAGMQAVVVEKVVGLSPDLVLAPNIIDNATVEQLRRAGLVVFRFELARSIPDVYEKTRLTGRLVGECDGADDTVQWMRNRIGTVREAIEGTGRPAIIYPLGGGFVAGDNTFIHEVITTAGGRNVAAAAGISGYGKINPEVVVTEDPEWLVLSDDLPETALLDVYNRTTAMNEGQVIRVNPNHANQPAPRVVYVVVELAETLHPEAYAEANATRSTPTDAKTAESTTTTSRTTGQPGFGVAMVLLALFLTGLLTRNLR